MSLVMGVALVLAGLVCVLVAREAPALIERSRSLSGPALAASVVAFGLSVWLLPLPPIVLFGVATVAFGWGRRAGGSPDDRVRVAGQPDSSPVRRRLQPRNPAMVTACLVGAAQLAKLPVIPLSFTARSPKPIPIVPPPMMSAGGMTA
jgi:hypothetical protein